MDDEISREEIVERLKSIGISMEGIPVIIFDSYISKIKTKILDFMNWRSGTQRESRTVRQYREQWNLSHADEIKHNPSLERLPDTRRDKLPPELCVFVIDMVVAEYALSWLSLPENEKIYKETGKYVASVSNGRTSYAFGINPRFDSIPGLKMLLSKWLEFPTDSLIPYRKLHRELEYTHPLFEWQIENVLYIERALASFIDGYTYTVPVSENNLDSIGNTLSKLINHFTLPDTDIEGKIGYIHMYLEDLINGYTPPQLLAW
jgi:hypothetical protein